MEGHEVDHGDLADESISVDDADEITALLEAIFERVPQKPADDERDAADGGTDRNALQQCAAAIQLRRFRLGGSCEATVNVCIYLPVNFLQKRCYYRVTVFRP